MQWNGKKTDKNNLLSYSSLIRDHNKSYRKEFALFEGEFISCKRTIPCSAWAKTVA